MSDRQLVRVLVVDDDVTMARLMASVLDGAGFATPRHVTTGEAALAVADEADIILLDHRLPDIKGIDLLPNLRARLGRPSVILITAHGNESLAAAALRQGAEDYLIKDHSLAELLPQVLERVRRNRALREALAAAERDLVHAERRAAIAQMSVTLHHTINNPLMTASAEVDLLLTGSPALGAEQRESLHSIKGSLQRIHEILQRTSTLRHDQTAEYLDGVAMIDLSRRTVPAPVHRGIAAIYVPEEDSARVIELLLRHGGFDVQRARSTSELMSLASEVGVALVIVAGQASGPGSDPLSGFRPASDRHYTLVALVTGQKEGALRAGADYVVLLPFDPGTFMQDLLSTMKAH